MSMTISWEIHTVEVAGYSTWSSLAVSPAGRIGVAYYSSIIHALRFATLSSGHVWAIETVDTSFGDAAPSLRTDTTNRPFATRRRSTRRGIQSNPLHEMLYAVRRGNSTDPWTISRVAQDVWTDSSLGFDASGNAGISFRDVDRALAYVRGDSTLSTWVVSAVDGPDAGAFNSLAVAPSGQPAIAYTSEDDHRTLIRYAAFDGGDMAQGHRRRGHRLVHDRLLAVRYSGDRLRRATGPPVFGELRHAGGRELAP